MSTRAHSYAHQAEVPVRIHIDDDTEAIDISTCGGFERSGSEALPTAEIAAETSSPSVRVPLIRVCWARSGDKGDTVNIGVIGRRREYMPILRAQLSAARVAQWFEHAIDAERGDVTRYEMPGIGALNFVLSHSLGGGGVASLRVDSLAKAFAQQMLAIEVDVPAAWFE